MERRLEELGDAVPAPERARAERSAADARAAMKKGASLERVRSLTSELERVYRRLGARSSGRAPPPNGARATGGVGSDDGAIDADFKVC